MRNINFRQTYNKYIGLLKKQSESSDEAMHLAVGGHFEAIGLLERDLLIQHGLKPDSYLVDVGCGSGRLAIPLSEYLNPGKLLGTDVVPDLLDYARQKVNRPDWRFEHTEGHTIPAEDGRADMVCFFSVFTHILHEHTYKYLQEAKRVVKPGGKIIFSFLEFAIPSHWDQFVPDATLDEDFPLTMFVSRDGIQAWAEHLDLEITGIYDGDKPHITLSQTVTFEDGRVMENEGNLGQSVCVLTKKQ
jgi:SAM-dependent methyltransferase